MKKKEFDLEWEYKIIEYYESIKKKLGNVKLTGYEEYNLANLIASEIHKGLLLSRSERIKRIISYIICDKAKFRVKQDVGSDYSFGYVIDIPFIRKDNETIINNAISFMGKPNLLELHRINKVSLKNIIPNLGILLKSYKSISQVDNIADRVYISSLMVMAKNVLQVIQKQDIVKKSKVFMVFQDHEFFANAMIQTVKINGGITITLQHGQNFYRRLFADHLGIENFTSDYRLLWNEFTKKQFLKAGFSEERLPVVGSTKYAVPDMQKENEAAVKEKNVFGVILDTPHYSFTSSTNKMLIECAEKICQKYGYKYYLKIHPVDTPDKYTDILVNNNCVSIVPKEMQMEEFCKIISFALSCGSGAIVDLYINNIQTFILKSYIPVPIETNEIYEFSTIEELQVKFEKWITEREQYTAMFSEIRALYTEEDAYQKHLKFFKKIGSEVKKIKC